MWWPTAASGTSCSAAASLWVNGRGLGRQPGGNRVLRIRAPRPRNPTTARTTWRSAPRGPRNSHRYRPGHRALQPVSRSVRSRPDRVVESGRSVARDYDHFGIALAGIRFDPHWEVHRRTLRIASLAIGTPGMNTFQGGFTVVRGTTQLQLQGGALRARFGRRTFRRISPSVRSSRPATSTATATTTSPLATRNGR